MGTRVTMVGILSQRYGISLIVVNLLCHRKIKIKKNIYININILTGNLPHSDLDQKPLGSLS